MIAVQLYATYAVTKAGLARFDEALPRELKGEGSAFHLALPYGLGASLGARLTAQIFALIADLAAITSIEGERFVAGSGQADA